MTTTQDFDVSILDGLNSDEILSLLLSNSLSREERKIIARIQYTKLMEEFPGIIGAVVVTGIILGIISSIHEKNVSEIVK